MDEYKNTLENPTPLECTLAVLWWKYNPHKGDAGHETHRAGVTSLDNMQIVSHCLKNDKDGKFRTVYERGPEGLFASHSEADAFLCSKVAFWSDRDPAVMDSVMRESALMRDKWDRDDYRERTIKKAIDWCSESISEYRERKERERRDILAAAWR